MDKDVNRNLAGRLWCLGLTVLGIAVAVGWLSVDASRQVSERAQNLVTMQMPQLRTISVLQDSVSRRVLHLYLFYATTDEQQWRELQGTQTEFHRLLHALELDATDTRLLNESAASFDMHAQDFHTEMTKASGRSWDALREHLAEAQVAADALTGSLADLAAKIRERAGEGGNLTMLELSRLSRALLMILAVLLLIAVLLLGMLRGRLRDQAELFRRAYYDRLTQLPNRARMEQDWNERIRILETVPGESVPACTVLAIQLDRYRLLTSSFGQAYGNSVVCTISSRLKALCAGSDATHTVYQFAVDAWLVVLDGMSDTDASVEAARSILRLFEEPLKFDEHEVPVTCSAGITFFPDHGRTADEMLRNCNSVLHRAQTGGGNRLVVYDQRMHRKSERFLSIESAMRRGLRNGEFELFYQPKLSAADLACVGAEALIRWRRNGQLISPAEFIPVAEESGLILPLGQWVIDEACRQWMHWHDAGLSPPPVAVNVSAQQFQSTDFVDKLTETLAHNGLPTAMLELEITEEATFDDPQTVVATMQAAKALGVSLALDDFGTGYSSLSCLTSFPLDVIKIDQKFVREMQTSERIFSVVEVIVALGHELGLRLVAEGVETRQQEAHLRALGCDLLQGFLYCRPVQARDYVSYFRNKGRGSVESTGVGIVGARS